MPSIDRLKTEPRLDAGADGMRYSSSVPLATPSPHRSLYVGTFFLALSTLTLEVSLTRLLSVVTWYHIAFFAVSTAMLGMTIGAIAVQLRPRRFDADRLAASLATFSLAFAASIPISLVALCLTPLALWPSIMTVIALAVVTAACTLPFVFSGIAISAALTRSAAPIGRLYAVDLLGAALGCVVALVGLETLDAPSLILACSIGGAAAALAYAGGRWTRRAWVVSAMVAVAGFVAWNRDTRHGLRPIFVKGVIDPAMRAEVEDWSSYARIVVEPLESKPPQYWGPSPKAPQEPLPQRRMHIDGGAGTTMRPGRNAAELAHLRYDLTNLGYELRPRGGAAIIGVGGGRDVQSARLFGHERVVGIELNPAFIDLIEGRYRDFVALADDPKVELVADEARSFLSRDRTHYALIQMSLIDTWAATGAGAFTLSENALYTREAWAIFLDHLDAEGIFTLSRWYDPQNIGETGRALALAVAALLDRGVQNPADHLAMAATDRLATLIVANRPLTDSDRATLQRVTDDLGFSLVLAPTVAPAHPLLASIRSARRPDELARATAGQALNYTPPDDDHPYFFNMARLSRLDALLRVTKGEGGVARGNLIATLTLLALLAALVVFSLATVILPVRLAGTGPVLWPAAAHFGLIGLGFMLVEIALLQRLSTFLGHPTYALGVILSTLIASAGIGSFGSEGRWAARWRRWLPLVAAALVLAARYALGAIASALVASSMAVKITAAVATITPVGMVLGLFFPIGLALVRAANRPETPWYWALNGTAGVLGSALAVFVSIYFGISTTFLAGAICYALLGFCWPAMREPA